MNTNLQGEADSTGLKPPPLPPPPTNVPPPVLPPPTVVDNTTAIPTATAPVINRYRQHNDVNRARQTVPNNNAIAAELQITGTTMTEVGTTTTTTANPRALVPHPAPSPSVPPAEPIQIAGAYQGIVGNYYLQFVQQANADTLLQMKLRTLPMFQSNDLLQWVEKEAKTLHSANQAIGIALQSHANISKFVGKTEVPNCLQHGFELKAGHGLEDQPYHETYRGYMKNIKRDFQKAMLKCLVEVKTKEVESFTTLRDNRLAQSIFELAENITFKISTENGLTLLPGGALAPEQKIFLNALALRASLDCINSPGKHGNLPAALQKHLGRTSIATLGHLITVYANSKVSDALGQVTISQESSCLVNMISEALLKVVPVYVIWYHHQQVTGRQHALHDTANKAHREIKGTRTLADGVEEVIASKETPPDATTMNQLITESTAKAAAKAFAKLMIPTGNKRKANALSKNKSGGRRPTSNPTRKGQEEVEDPKPPPTQTAAARQEAQRTAAKQQRQNKAKAKAKAKAAREATKTQGQQNKRKQEDQESGQDSDQEADPPLQSQKQQKKKKKKGKQVQFANKQDQTGDQDEPVNAPKSKRRKKNKGKNKKQE